MRLHILGTRMCRDNPRYAMNLVPLCTDSIPFGKPLPFVLRNAQGGLLAPRGFIVRNPEELQQLITRGVALMVDTDESEESHRAYLGELQKMLISEKSLGEIASTAIPAQAVGAKRARVESFPPDWTELQESATQLLRAPHKADFAGRFAVLHNTLAYCCSHAPDATLLALIHLSAQETRLYSATHAMLVACACMVTAREVLHWPEARVQILGQAALSMNIGMAELQDQLAQQSNPLSTAQVQAVEAHAARSESLLRQLGVTEPAWLEAVRLHHHRQTGPLADKTEGQQMARLIQRADIFAARLAPRITRTPMAVTAAMQASYYDEDRKVDEAGAALVKALGIYPPGAFVRLASQEVALVLRRGSTANTPRVAVLVNREGIAVGEPIRRDTTQAQWKITAPVAHKDLRVKTPLERLMAIV